MCDGSVWSVEKSSGVGPRWDQAASRSPSGRRSAVYSPVCVALLPQADGRGCLPGIGDATRRTKSPRRAAAWANRHVEAVRSTGRYRPGHGRRTPAPDLPGLTWRP